MAGATLTTEQIAALPPRVRKDYEDTEKALDTLREQREAANQVEDISAPPVGEPEGTPAAPVESSPAEPETPPVTPNPPAAERDADLEALRQEFRTLKGKYDAEVPRMAGALREKEEELVRLRAELESKPAAPPASIPTQRDDLTREKMLELGFTEDQIDNGLDLWAGVFHAISLGVATQLEQRVQPLERHVASSAEKVYWDTLETACPDYRDYNTDPGFLAYLRGYEPKARRTRSELLREAEAALDGAAVAEFFNEYKASMGKETRVPKATAPARAAQVKPPRQNNSPTPMGEKPTYTIKEYERIMNDLVRKRINGRPAPPDELAQMEKEMDAAVREGRLR